MIYSGTNYSVSIYKVLVPFFKLFNNPRKFMCHNISGTLQFKTNRC